MILSARIDDGEQTTTQTFTLVGILHITDISTQDHSCEVN